jgi:putative flippase GtrA
MKYSPRSIIAWSRTHEGRKIVRYTLTSAITTVVSNGSILILYGFRIIPGVIWSTLVGNVIGMLPAYQLNRRWTWGKSGRSKFRMEVAPFAAMSILGIAFSQLGAWWAKDEVASHHWHHLANTGLVAGANLVCFGIFWVLKLIVFNRIFHVHPLELMDEHLTVEEESAAS